MRVLYLTNGFPWPLTSGYLRHYFLLREISRDHAVTLLSLVAPSHREEHRAALEPFAERILTFASTTKGRSLPRKVADRLRSWFEVEPAVQQMRAAVARLAKEERFDVVFCGKKALPAIEPVADLPLVADMCDAASMRIEMSMRYAGPARRWLLGLERQQTLRIEQEMVRRARSSVFVSARDRDAVCPGADVATTIVPNGVDVDFWRRKSHERGCNTIVFTGAMDYRPNTDAALHLVEDVLPIVRRSVPEARLLVVGRDPTARLRAAGRGAGVEVTGFVDDVRTHLEQATVFAAPLRFGAGIQNKVLEAMAMEVPVVATRLAADGLRTVDGAVPPIEIEDDPMKFAELLVRRLRDPDLTPDGEARRYVESRFVWSKSGALLSQVLREAVPDGEPEEVECSPWL
jgi:glycosyltransferase involved in cell wall biosynthesis